MKKAVPAKKADAPKKAPAKPAAAVKKAPAKTAKAAKAAPAKKVSSAKTVEKKVSVSFLSHLAFAHSVTEDRCEGGRDKGYESQDRREACR